MKKTLLVTLEIDCTDMSGDELYECVALECVEVKDLERLRHIKPSELGWIIAESIEHLGPQFFEGTGVYVKFVSGRVRGDAEFIPTPRKKRPRTMPDKRPARPARPAAEQQTE